MDDRMHRHDRAPRPDRTPRRTRALLTCALLTCALLLVPACMVGPDYEAPEVPLAAAFTANEPGQPPVDSAALARWWELFGDEQLSHTVMAALDGNLALRVAAARILQARAVLDVASGNIYPQQQTLNASAMRVGQSRDTVQGAFVPRVFEEFTVGANLSWEIDLWGRLRRAIEASEAQLDAAVADFDDVVVLLVAEVGSTYIDLRTFEERLRLARENAELQRETLELARVRLEEGAVSVLDVQQAQTVVGRTEASIPSLEAGRRQAQHALAVLLGRPPRDPAAAFGAADLPRVPDSVTISLPAELLRQRPDVRRAERQLAAQSARIGIAEAEFYPALSLQGSLGWAAREPSDLFRHRSLAGNIGAGLDWKVLNYGRLEAGVRAEQAAYDALLETYRGVVLQAQREVEDALEAFARARDRVEALERSVTAAAAAAETVAAQYRGGAVPYTAVFLSQTTLVEQHDALAVARGDQAQAFIAIYRALGGGWQIVQELQREDASADDGDAAPH